MANRTQPPIYYATERLENPRAPVYFASGSNYAGEVRGFVDIGHPVGVAADGSCDEKGRDSCRCRVLVPFASVPFVGNVNE